MASAPPEKPESIFASSFAGLKNTVSSERLSLADLERAVNIDLDDAGQARRRRGYDLKIAGNFHSAYTHDGKTFVVKDNTLGIVRPDYSFSEILGVGPERLSYTAVGEQLYFSSSIASGIVLPDETTTPWGTPGAGTWLSPVIRPTDTLGEIRGKLLGPPPMATQIEYYKGRIYMAHERVLWATELFLYNYVDKTRTYFHFEHDITLVAAVDDGLYVGTTENIYFLQGEFGTMKRAHLMRGRALPGSCVRMPASSVHPDARQSPSFPEMEAVVFMTDAGIVAGFPGGRLINLTSDRVIFPGATSAAGLYREDSGANSYVAVADSGGTPSANARIGDWVDAEIVRFQG